MRFRVLFVHGPAAAGKYTVGRLVSERLGWPLFHNHLTVDLVATLFEFGTPPFVELREHIWRQAFRLAAEAGRSFVFTFNPEATVAAATVEALAREVETAGGEMLYVELACSDAEVLRRIDNESRQAFGKLTDGALYRAVKAGGGFDFPALPEPFVRVDTETVTAPEAAELILTALADRLEAHG